MPDFVVGLARNPAERLVAYCAKSRLCTNSRNRQSAWPLTAAPFLCASRSCVSAPSVCMHPPTRGASRTAGTAVNGNGRTERLAGDQPFARPQPSGPQPERRVLTAAAPRWQTPAWPAMTPGPGSASCRAPAVRLPRSYLCLTGYLQAVYLRKQAQIQQLAFLQHLAELPGVWVRVARGDTQVCAAMRAGASLTDVPRQRFGPFPNDSWARGPGY